MPWPERSWYFQTIRVSVARCSFVLQSVFVIVGVDDRENQELHRLGKYLAQCRELASVRRPSGNSSLSERDDNI